MGNNKKERAELPPSITEGVLSTEEAFQNKTVRPIVKTQSELLKRFVLSQLEFMKVDFDQLNALKKKQSLAALILKNQQFKREIIGIIIVIVRFENNRTPTIKNFYTILIIGLNVLYSKKVIYTISVIITERSQTISKALTSRCT